MQSQLTQPYIAPHSVEDIDQTTAMRSVHDSVDSPPDAKVQSTGPIAAVDRRVWITVDETWW
jgi:hypothetical protein